MPLPKKLLMYALMAVLAYVFIKHVLIHLLITLAGFLLGIGAFIAIIIILLPAKKEKTS